MSQSRNNYISTAKGIGIILMVIGHCGAPDLFTKFIYQFHMPLFFFCSGFFLKNIEDKCSLYNTYKKRFIGIYIKFLCWSLLFLALHNVFFHLNIYNDIISFRGEPSHLYSSLEFINKAIRIVFSMNEHEQLLRSFWFLKQLFISSIIVSSTIYLTNRFTHNKYAQPFILIGFVGLTVISKYYRWSLPAVWDISLISMSSTFYLSGYIFRKYDILAKVNNLTSSILFLTLSIIGIIILPWTNMLEYTIITVTPFFIVAFSGTILVLNLSQILETYNARYVLYYLGQNTMAIFALHMLCFKLGNLIKIAIYNMPIYRLAEFQIIYEHNSIFWVVYTIIGICIPLVISLAMRRFLLTKHIWNYFT